MQWGLVGGGTTLFVVGMINYTDNQDIPLIILSTGAVAVGVGVVWNAYRSYTYCKPGSVACGSNSGFNISVLPTRHGNLLPAVTYSRGF
jgi:hypothetical protein